MTRATPVADSFRQRDRAAECRDTVETHSGGRNLFCFRHPSAGGRMKVVRKGSPVAPSHSHDGRLRASQHGARLLIFKPCPIGRSEYAKRMAQVVFRRFSTVHQ